MAAATILDCRLREIIIADGVWRSRPIIVPNFVKNCRSVTEILRFFEFLRWPPLPSLIFEIAKLYWLWEWRGSRRISMPNSVNRLRRYFDFSIFKDGGRRHLVLFNLQNFIGWRCSEGHYVSLYQISSKSIFCCGDIAIFQIFKMAAAAILDFWNHEILLAISLKSVNRLRRC